VAAVDETKTLLHYRIFERLGEGGMGVVYRAEDTRMGRTVALKVLRRELVADEEWNRRFEREVRVASSFSHPGIATIYDFQQDGDTWFYTMEYVEGHNLRELLKKSGPPPVPQLIRCALQVAEALAQAHRKGVVHRDLKPENVMESDSGYFKILDFGLARYADAGMAAPGSGSALETRPQETTQAGRIVGTVSYMSPEQAQGLPVDARSDIFSFGSLFYEMAAGPAPFTRANAIATFHAIVHEEVRPLREVRPDAPPELEWIIGRCLAKEPRDRYQEASELAEDLRALQSASESGGRGTSAIRGYPGANVARSLKIWGTSTHRWAVATWGSMLVILALIAGRLLLFPAAPAAPRPLPEPTAAGAASGAGTPAEEAASTSRRTIAVSPFVNSTGDAKDGWLVQGIPQMITTSLAGTGRLSVVSTQRLNDLMSMAGRDGAAGVDGATATELARWAGAGIVISGSIYRTGGDYRIDSQAYDTATGEVLAASRTQGADVFGLVDRITEELTRGLPGEREGAEVAGGGPPAASLEGRSGPASAAGGAPASAAATPATAAASAASRPVSPDAYRLYMDGISHYKDLRFEEGIHSFEQALAIEPGFAPAQMRLGMSLVLEGDAGSGVQWIERASGNGAGLPEKDRLIAHIVDAGYTARDAKAAEEEVEAYAIAFPKDQEAQLWLAQSRVDVQGDHVGAVRVLSRIVREEPDNLPAVALLGRSMAEMGSVEEAIGILEDYRQRFPRAAEKFERMIRELRARAQAPPEAPGAGR
jgi:TolB-like protein/predicted Ser/Thr protein kinase